MEVSIHLETAGVQCVSAEETHQCGAAKHTADSAAGHYLSLKQNMTPTNLS